MTTQQSEGAILGEKPLKAASLPIAKDGPNGSPAINGYVLHAFFVCRRLVFFSALPCDRI